MKGWVAVAVAVGAEVVVGAAVAVVAVVFGLKSRTGCWKRHVLRSWLDQTRVIPKMRRRVLEVHFGGRDSWRSSLGRTAAKDWMGMRMDRSRQIPNVKRLQVQTMTRRKTQELAVRSWRSWRRSPRRSGGRQDHKAKTGDRQSSRGRWLPQSCSSILQFH